MPDTAKGDQEAIMAILYQQHAAEYKALCLQSYNLAKWKVEDAVNHAALDKEDLPLAVVTDLDETALDNSKNEVYQYQHHKTYNPVQFNQWCRLEMADTVLGSVAFFNCVDQLKDRKGRKIDIYYISNRSDSVLGSTINNMKKLGFPQLDSSHFKLSKAGSSPSKEARRQEVLSDHKIVVLLGDNLIDLDAAFDGCQQSPDDRTSQVYSLRNRWGDLYIVFPNAIYGDWELYLYYDYMSKHNCRYPPFSEEKIERDGQLKGY